MVIPLRSSMADETDGDGEGLGRRCAYDLIDPDTPATILAETETAHLLSDAISGLIPSHRRVLILRYERDYTFEQIGAYLGISAKNAFALHSRAVAQLRIALDLMGAGSRLAFAA